MEPPRAEKVGSTSTGPKRLVPLIECSTCPNYSISGTSINQKEVPLIELLPFLFSLENGAFTNNEKQGERNKRIGFIRVYVPYDDYF